MNTRTLATAFAVLLTSSTALAVEIVVDFEAAPDGTTLSEGTDLTDVYEDWYVHFYLPGTARKPVVATEGFPRKGFEVTIAGTVYADLAYSGVNTLTDGFNGRRDFGASFDHPVSEVALQLIDFGDCGTFGPVSITLYAYDASGAVVDSDTYSVRSFRPGSPLDGSAAPLAVGGADITSVETRGGWRDCGKAVDDFTFVLQDSDGDGVPDGEDDCPDTASGAVVDDVGCSIDDYCPCDGAWKNHGAYVSCVAKTTKDFVADGWLDSSDRGDLVSDAARSECGK